MSGTKTMCTWINNNTFLAISDFVDKRFLNNFAFGRLRTSSDFFGRLRTSSGIFGNDRVVCKNPRTRRTKISHLYLRKSWQVYVNVFPDRWKDTLWVGRESYGHTLQSVAARSIVHKFLKRSPAWTKPERVLMVYYEIYVWLQSVKE